MIKIQKLHNRLLNCIIIMLHHFHLNMSKLILFYLVSVFSNKHTYLHTLGAGGLLYPVSGYLTLKPFNNIHVKWSNLCLSRYFYTINTSFQGSCMTGATLLSAFRSTRQRGVKLSCLRTDQSSHRMESHRRSLGRQPNALPLGLCMC